MNSYVGILLFIIFIIGFSIMSVSVSQRGMKNQVLKQYCKSNNATFMIIQDRESCIKDNKIKTIEWYTGD